MIKYFFIFLILCNLNASYGNCRFQLQSFFVSVNKSNAQYILEKALLSEQLSLKDGLDYIEAIISQNNNLTRLSPNFKESYLKLKGLDKIKIMDIKTLIKRAYLKLRKKEIMISKNIKNEEDFIIAINKIYIEHLDTKLIKINLKSILTHRPRKFLEKYSELSLNLLDFYKTLNQNNLKNLEEYLFEPRSLPFNIDKKAKIRTVLSYIRGQSLKKFKLSREELLSLNGLNHNEITLFIKKKYGIYNSINWSLSFFNSVIIARYAYLYGPFWGSFIIVSPYLYLAKKNSIENDDQNSRKLFDQKDHENFKLIFGDKASLRLKEIQLEFRLKSFKDGDLEQELIDNLKLN